MGFHKGETLAACERNSVMWDDTGAHVHKSIHCKVIDIQVYVCLWSFNIDFHILSAR